MKIKDIKRGQKVKNKFGKILTVIEVIDGLMVRTYEEYNNLYHISNLLVNSKRIEF